MSLTVRASVSMTLGLALALTATWGAPAAVGDAPHGPVLVLPSPAFGNRLISGNLLSGPVQSGPIQSGPVQSGPVQGDSEANGLALPAGPLDSADGRTMKPAAPDANDGGDDGPEVAEFEEPAPVLSPGMAALRDRVRRTMAAHQAQMLSTADNTVTEVMYACRAFGCNTEVFEAVTLRQNLNGITCLTWNYPCLGFAPLTISDGYITGRVGYGYQEHPGELLAILALARVPSSYPARVGDEVRTVSDLVEYEKLACREGTDKSLTMIGLMYYAGPDSEWRNAMGETWSIERILKEELDKPVVCGPWGGTQRLLGISYVVRRRASGQPLEGQYRRAHDYLLRFHDHALALQNDDGSWSAHYLAAKGSSQDPGAVLASTGRILEWLAFSLPVERLDEPGVVRAVHFCNQMLSAGRYAPQNRKALRTEEIGAAMHALAALRHYDDRVFRPFDPPAPAAPSAGSK